MVGPARQWRRRGAVWLIVVALLATAGCFAQGSGDTQRKSPYLVSYAGAATYLGTLESPEATEQLRDWARLGLASELGLSRDQTFNALYDTAPVRDPAFAGMVEQPTGPGRALFDGSTLHLLVPRDDPHPSRTIGLLLDQHRADAGSDPRQVQIHHYLVRPRQQKIELSAGPAELTGEVRAANGWTQRRVDQESGLAGFLAATDKLSRLTVRDGHILASGWRWPHTTGAEITPEDVAVLQRGYRQPSGTLPGFSLDPGPPATLGDIRAAIPGLAPELATRISTGNWAGSGFASAAALTELVKGTLFQNQPPAGTLRARGLPDDRRQLWALLKLLDGQPMYSQARYDGGLAGTEVGNTLFYTDLVAKNWTFGVGTGKPADTVPGFVPEPQADTPPSLCPRKLRDERGRLWWGQHSEGFAYDPNGVSIGAQPTRLFSRSTGPGGGEVEPSFLLGRPLNWWNDHQQAVADFEPQYHRLSELMSWSAAVEWLAATGHEPLPQLPDDRIHSGLRFADWYAEHGELRERAPLPLVTPPSATQEAVLTTPSATTKDCGLLQIFGGVSLAGDFTKTGELRSAAAALPRGMRRAGRITAGSGRITKVTVNDPGQITDPVSQTIRRDTETASVETTGRPHRTIPFGDARLVTRQLHIISEFRSSGKDMNYDLFYDLFYEDRTKLFYEDRTKLVEMQARTVPSNGFVLQTDIVMLFNPFGQLKKLANPGSLKKLANKLTQNGARAPDSEPGFRYSYRTSDGSTVVRLPEGWVEFGPRVPASRKGLTIEVALPGAETVTMYVVKPPRLSEPDVNALEVTRQERTDTFGNLRKRVPDEAAVYVSTMAGLAGADRPSSLFHSIRSDANVRYRVVQETGDGTTPGPLAREGRTWSFVGADSGAGGGSAGPGGFGPLINLIVVCPDTDQHDPPPKQEDDEVCG